MMIPITDQLYSAIRMYLGNCPHDNVNQMIVGLDNCKAIAQAEEKQRLEMEKGKGKGNGNVTPIKGADGTTPSKHSKRKGKNALPSGPTDTG
ncbi:MAG: hypothetical protein V3V10_06835 [Planctomycetota bacterium]